ncbi:MAG: Hsp20/alpha crystallin family protein, partial [Treponema sp.]|nr:Hsp20/alpha crystallin family protein [Treponema sp.]
MRTIALYRPHAIEGLFERPNALSDFDRYFESFFGDSPLAPATKVFNRLPAVDVRETEKTYELEMELPGYDEKDIEIHVDGSSLSIASRQGDKGGGVPPAATLPADAATSVDAAGKEAAPKETWLLKERRVNAFSRSFKLPENANPEEVTAEFKNGILRMEIQKRA